jgi:ADP-heptose:LPS heptosyltransferase
MTTPSLLIVHQGALGDLVCIFPVIRALRRRFHPVSILCQGHLGKLAAAENLADAWFPIEAAWTASLFSGEANRQAARLLAPYSHSLVFSRSEALAASLKHIAGARVCSVPPRPPAGRRVHIAEHTLHCIQECGWLPEFKDAILKATPSHGSAAAPGEGEASKTVLIHPGAGSPRKRWPLPGFLELTAQINARQLKPAFVIGPVEQDLLPELERHGATLHLTGDSLKLLALLRSAAAYIGNDSGVSHLAAWVGLPCVVIFGPSDPVRWRPWGGRVEIVQPTLECTPCFEIAAANCAAADCLAAIHPGDVMQAFQRVAHLAECPI